MNADDVAERIRSAMVEAAVRAYENAGVQGLCAEGRWEAAVSAMQSLDLATLIEMGTTAESDASA
jgi:hypothetical protein